MPITYPEAPGVRRFREGMLPSEKPAVLLRAVPYEGEILLDFTSPLGAMTGISYSLFFQLPRWGFWRGKIDEWIFVSHVFREYYEMTVRQKEALEASIKEGLRSVGTAISDLDLIMHDLRKYREFLDYFTWIERGKILMKGIKKKEGEELLTKGEQSLKAVFIDMVDAYTGEAIAMKSIAPRWPTIIADFMRLKDNQTDPKSISKDLKVSEAEGVVLSTKNKLYVEWRDNLFKETVKKRYESLLRQVEARKKSLEEYKNMLKDKIARQKMVKDALEDPFKRGMLYKSFFRPDSQAISIDFMRLWAWKPFAPAEKYKNVRVSFDKIHAVRAGFTPKEIRKLEEKLPKLPEMQGKFKGGKWDDYVDTLPQEPSIDNVVRKLKKQIEIEYGVELNEIDLYKAREMLLSQFRESFVGLGGVEPWVWSPYFVFLDLPLGRTVIKIPPAGPELEDLMMENFQAATESQNIIIARCLEFIAKDKKLENHISTMLGETGVRDEETKKTGIEKPMSIEDMMKEDFPEVYTGKTKEKREEEKESHLEEVKPIERAWVSRQNMIENFNKLRGAIGDFFKDIGWEVSFFRAIGPYEFNMNHRIAKFYQPVTAGEFERVRRFIETRMGVPGVEVNW